jgi:hypothetical protein
MEELLTWFWPGNLKESAYVGDVVVDGRIKVGINDKGWVAMDWIYLAEGRDD